jgi:hypothetical protein
MSDPLSPAGFQFGFLVGFLAGADYREKRPPHKRRDEPSKSGGSKKPRFRLNHAFTATA